jgi:hypothetical protein
MVGAGSPKYNCSQFKASINPPPTTRFKLVLTVLAAAILVQKPGFFSGI